MTPRFVCIIGVAGMLGCGANRADAQAPVGAPAPAPAEAPVLPTAPVKEALRQVDLAASVPQAEQGQQSHPTPSKKPMLDVEARFRIETKDVAGGVTALRKLVGERGGYVVQESLNTEQYSAPQAEVSLRVPAAGVESFFQALGTLGEVRARNVESKDVGKEYFDAELRLSNLEQSRKRYEELLARASTVEQTVAVEAKLDEVRERIETLKGELRWLRDRTAQATVHVMLFSPASVTSPYEEPTAAFYPGVRLSYVRSLGGTFPTEDFVGPGLSLRLGRYFSVDVEGLPSTTGGYGGEDFDLFLATIGGELYSDFLGGGQRRFFNPYIGFRGGYARFLTLNQVALGGVIGVEIYKLPILTVDLEMRGYALFSADDPSHALVQPGLGVNIGF